MEARLCHVKNNADTKQLRIGEVLSRLAHNQENGGANPSSATNLGGASRLATAAVLKTVER